MAEGMLTERELHLRSRGRQRGFKHDILSKSRACLVLHMHRQCPLARALLLEDPLVRIVSCVYIECLRSCAIMAEELGLAEDQHRWQKEVERITSVYNSKLLVTDHQLKPYAHYTSRDEPGKIDCDAIAQAIALQFKLVPAEYIQEVQQAFLDDVRDCRIRAGEIGLRYLWNTMYWRGLSCSMHWRWIACSQHPVWW